VRVAERERLRRIFTLDRRDFQVYRPYRIGASPSFPIDRNFHGIHFVCRNSRNVGGVLDSGWTKSITDNPGSVSVKLKYSMMYRLGSLRFW
jgi:hypothetical protein